MPRRRTIQRRKRRGIEPSTIIFILLLIAMVYLYENGTLQRWIEQITGRKVEVPTIPVPSVGVATPTAQPPAAGTGDIQVIFTTPSLVYPDNRNQRGASPLLQAVIADIDAARKSVDLAVFDFDIPELTDALVRAKQRGVAVRVIVDSENLEAPEVSQETGRLQSTGIPVRFDEREPFMHNKFMVVDAAMAWTGSWNATANDTFRNNNNFVRLNNSLVAADYTREFDQMFGGLFGTKKASDTPYPRVQLGSASVEVYFSPEDGIAKHILERLQNAKSSIRFMAFSFTSDDIANQMVAKVKAGLTVEGVFERQNANGSGADFALLKGGGVNVLEDGSCYILHHKVIIIDEQTVITGSYNFTSSAENSNDENLVMIDAPEIARAYIDEFNRVFQQAQAPTRCG